MKNSLFRSVLILSVSIGILHGCYVADAYFIEEPPKSISLQKSCEQAIEAYVRAKSNNLPYTSYGFSKAEIHVPQEILVLEDMEKNRAEGFLEGPETDSIIQAKRNFIETNKIQRTAHLDHFYTLRNSTNTLTILETKFVLDDTLGVLDYQPLILLVAPASLEIALNYYMNEYSVISSMDVVEARKLSNRFYNLFKKRQDELVGVEAKSAFLLHSLKATEFAIKTGQFVPADFIQYSSESFLTQDKDSSIIYKSYAFSPLYEKTYEGKITGYYIFHKFSLAKMSGTETVYAVRLEISPYFEILSRTYLDEPFDSYFN